MLIANAAIFKRAPKTKQPAKSYGTKNVGNPNTSFNVGVPKKPKGSTIGKKRLRARLTATTKTRNPASSRTDLPKTIVFSIFFNYIPIFVSIAIDKVAKIISIMAAGIVAIAHLIINITIDEKGI